MKKTNKDQGLVGVKPRIICLCGSSRFCEEIAVKKWEFEKKGMIAIGLHLLPNWYMPVEHHGAEYEGVAQILDELHLRKIELADEVFIMNCGGYIGERTAYEIQYAKSLDKIINYYEKV